jgi:hypothetical protein
MKKVGKLFFCCDFKIFFWKKFEPFFPTLVSILIATVKVSNLGFVFSVIKFQK